MLTAVQSELKMVRRVLNTIMEAANCSEEVAQEFLERRYLNRYEDRFFDEVIEHFAMIWKAVCREVADRTGLPVDRFSVVVQPSLDGPSFSVVLYNPYGYGGQQPVVLLYDAVDAPVFYWPNRDVMEAYLEIVVRDWIRRLQNAGVLPRSGSGDPRMVPVEWRP